MLDTSRPPVPNHKLNLKRAVTEPQLNSQVQNGVDVLNKSSSLADIKTEKLNTTNNSQTFKALSEEAENTPAVFLLRIFEWFFGLDEEKKSENKSLADFILNLGTDDFNKNLNKEKAKEVLDLVGDNEQKLKAIQDTKISDKSIRELVGEIEDKIKVLKGGTIRKDGKYGEAIKDIKKTESKYNKISNEQDPKREKYNFINELIIKTNEAVAQAEVTFEDNPEALKRAEKNIYESFKNQMKNSGYSESFGKTGTFGNSDKEYFKKIQDNYDFEKEDSRVQDKIKKLNEKLNEVSDKFSEKYNDLQNKTEELEKRKSLVKGINEVKIPSIKSNPLKDITGKPALSPTILTNSKSKVMGFKNNQGNSQV